MAAYDYDLFVIGGGSGGVRGARMASTAGARVAIAEEYRYGGTCVIRGCVPKKLLVYASHFHEEFDNAAGFGWTFDGEATFDWSTLIASKDKEIDRLEGLADGGSPVFSLSFAGRQLGHGPTGVRHFAFAIPLDQVRPEELQRVRLSAPGSALALAEIERADAPGAGDVLATRLDGGRVRLQWGDERPSVVVVRDPESGAILSFARGADALVGTDAAALDPVVAPGLGGSPRRVIVR